VRRADAETRLAWWLVLPACLGLLGAIATWQLSEALLLYRY